MRRLSSAIVLAMVIATTGCSSVHVISSRMGAVYTSRGEGCSISFENLKPEEAQAKYESIGAITVSGTAEITEDVKQDIEAEACKIGAHAVMPGSSTSMPLVMGMSSGLMQFVALRKREAAQ